MVTTFRLARRVSLAALVALVIPLLGPVLAAGDQAVGVPAALARQTAAECIPVLPPTRPPQLPQPDEVPDVSYQIVLPQIGGSATTITGAPGQRLLAQAQPAPDLQTRESLSNAASMTAGFEWPREQWTMIAPAEAGMDETLLAQARDYALIGGGSGYITRHGKLVMSWGDPLVLYDIKSTTKSIGLNVLGLAVGDGMVQLDDRARQYYADFGLPPDSNQDTGWLDNITFTHLVNHTAGFDKPGGYASLLFAPGDEWSYSDGGANWLADVLTVLYGRDLYDVMFERVFTPLGISPSNLTWRSNVYREQRINGILRRELAAGIVANVDAMARIGYLYLRQGSWEGRQIIPQAFVQAAITPFAGGNTLVERDPVKYPGAARHYGMYWWLNNDAALPGVPQDAYWSWGHNENLIVVIPSLDIVVARGGEAWQEPWRTDYGVLEPFLGPIVASVKAPTLPPCPLE